ncbi:MAG: serine/threonine-protein phosphatase [Candidatus Adiutrix sp.]|jgi:hypothetical protein|nr:serine/threonine-protein phosphatase [Candidatus Adiutrix sp.]
MFIDIHCSQEKKFRQNAYGDCFRSLRKPEEGRVIAVLSDGLGSGVKASILSLMTATMLLRFVEEDIEITKAAEIVMNSLPVCRVRKISYATFSVMECDDEGNVRLVEEGNPDFIWMRGTEVMNAPCRLVPSKSFPDRRLKVYSFQVEMGDRLICCSDGVTQAGLGRRGPYMTGLQRDGLIELLKATIKMHRNISSSELSRSIVESALAVEADGLAKDDVSAGVIYFRTPRRAVVFTGAPYDQRDDAHYAAIFNKIAGRKAICGGATAAMLGRELGRQAVVDTSLPSGGLPPQSRMPGVDLVTEGILTLTRALTYLEKAQLDCRDPAGALVDFMLASDALHFMVGAKVNEAHHNPRHPVTFEIRREVVQKIIAVLKDKYLKKVTLQYI